MSSGDWIMPRRALVSVSDKTGVVELGRALGVAGVEIVSTGSTAQALRDAGVAVREVSEVTGFQEALDGRVKTLHPSIHGGILADRQNPDHVKTLDDLDITAIDWVIVNLYPFVETLASGAADEEIIEQIDIGGPAVGGAAGEKHHRGGFVRDPAEYEALGRGLEEGG